MVHFGQLNWKIGSESPPPLVYGTQATYVSELMKKPSQCVSRCRVGKHHVSQIVYKTKKDWCSSLLELALAVPTLKCLTFIQFGIDVCLTWR